MNKRFSKWKQDVSTKFGSAHGCAVRTGALKSDWAVQDKKWLGQLFFWLLFFGCSKKSNTPSRAEYQQRRLRHQLTSKTKTYLTTYCRTELIHYPSLNDSSLILQILDFL
jgi:hypothetical protein